MRNVLALAVVLAVAPFAVADLTVSGPALAAGPLTVDAATVSTMHTTWSQDPPCAFSGRTDAAEASGGAANEHATARAEQQRVAYDCGSTGTSETTFVTVERRTGDSASAIVYAAAYDTDASNGEWCGTFVSVASMPAMPGCLPLSQRVPYVLDVLP